MFLESRIEGGAALSSPVLVAAGQRLQLSTASTVIRMLTRADKRRRSMKREKRLTSRVEEEGRG